MFFLFFISPSFSHSSSFDRLLITSGRVDKSHAAPKEKYPCLNILYSRLPSSVSLHPSISPSLNTSCRARSWLIRALVANASSPSPTAEMNGDQMRSSYEVGCWVIGDTRVREGEMKVRGRQTNEMNVYSGMYPLLEVLWFPGRLTKHLNS